jgi:hypothetical protein
MKNTPKSERTYLILRYRTLCPDIIESNISEADFGKRAMKSFSTIVKLIDDTATSPFGETTIRVFKILLGNYVQSIVPSLVINFVDRCIKTIDPYLRIITTTEQTIVLTDYVIAQMSSVEHSTTESSIQEFFNILEALNSNCGITEFKKVLQNISQRNETSLKPPMDEPHLLVLNCLVEELGNVFYGCEEVVEEKTQKSISLKQYQQQI